RTLRDACGVVQRELVVRLELGRMIRQCGYERARILARLEQHETLVGEYDLDDVLFANDLAAYAVEGNQPLADASVVIAVDDVHRLGVVAEHVHESAFVVELDDRTIHAVEPPASVLGRSVERDERE